MILFKECDVFTPEKIGRKDVLLAGKNIIAIADKIDLPAALIKNLDVGVIPAKGLRMIPGLIDSHVHIAGAGGEGGPASRTPEMPPGKMIEGGITTVIGCLGTDGLTRSVESVLMKAKGLRAEGLSAWIYTGSYQVPPPTLLGDVGKDIALIDEVIGVGEIAVSDHRSSGPTVEQLIHLVEHARVGGLLGGKAGIVNFHIGDAKNPFDILYQVVEKSELKFSQFLPTHCNRNPWIFEDAKEFGKKGYVDLTTSSYPYYPDEEVKSSTGVVELVKAGVPLEHITMSSDGCGSLPRFDASGNLISLDSGEPKSLFIELIDLVEKEKFPMEKALQVVTSNVAGILKLSSKGRIAVGMDADVVLLDKEYRILHLTANGVLMVKEGKRIKKSFFE